MMTNIFAILGKVNRFFAETTGYLIAIIVILLVVDTVGYLIKRQIHGVIELAVFTTIASAYIGLAYTEQHRAHIRVAALTGRFSPKIQLGLNIFWGMVSFVLIALTTYAAFFKAVEAFVEGEAIASETPMPVSPIRFVIAVSLLLYCFQILANFIIDARQLGRPDRRPPNL